MGQQQILKISSLDTSFSCRPAKPSLRHPPDTKQVLCDCRCLWSDKIQQTAPKRQIGTCALILPHCPCFLTEQQKPYDQEIKNGKWCVMNIPTLTKLFLSFFSFTAPWPCPWRTGAYISVWHSDMMNSKGFNQRPDAHITACKFYLVCAASK